MADDETVDFTSVSAPVEIRPRIRRLDSSTTRRDRRISSDDFEKMIVSIVKDKAPLSAPSQTSPLMASTKQKLLAPPAPPTLTRSGSTTTESQSSEQISEDSHASPLPPSDGLRVQALAFPEPAAAASSQDVLPEPSSSPAPKHVQPKKQPARFALGGSCSSSEHSQSIENIKATSAAVGKKPMFQIGGSLCKQSESAVDSDTEAEYVDESAIDDDDSSDWEDSTEDSGKSSVDDKFFQRVESKANLASRPSLITLMLAQNERARTLGNQASQSTPAIHRTRAAPNGPSLGVSPNDSDEAPLMMKGMRHSPLKPISEIPRSSAQPITTHATHVNFPAAFSPRTTRRNMLATELTESLRLTLFGSDSRKNWAARQCLSAATHHRTLPT
ncbi:hypothetical protein J3459_008357 [Metarhizium acridum]|nr:hypothetical protein J3459_008357 [Metarhizium acridum]